MLLRGYEQGLLYHKKKLRQAEFNLWFIILIFNLFLVTKNLARNKSN